MIWGEWLELNHNNSGKEKSKEGGKHGGNKIAMSETQVSESPKPGTKGARRKGRRKGGIGKVLSWSSSSVLGSF